MMDDLGTLDAAALVGSAADANAGAMAQSFAEATVLAEEMMALDGQVGRHGLLWGGGGGVSPRCYEIESIEDGAVTFANPYLMAGSVLYSGPSVFTPDRSCVLALEIPSEGMSFSCEFVAYDSVAELSNNQKDPDVKYYIIPLYQFDVEEDGSVSVACDFRSVPTSVVGDFATE